MCPQVVNVVRTGQRGRPQKIPNEAFLREAMASGRGIKITKLAKVIDVHRNTLIRYLKKYEIDYQHSGITDDELDTLVREFREEKPNSGVRYTTGYRGSSTISFLTTSTPTVTLSVITGTPIRYPGTVTIKAPWCVSSLVYIFAISCVYATYRTCVSWDS